MFKDPELPSQKKRQAFMPVFPNQLNYTDEQRALCGDDHACLFDYAVTGSVSFAMTTLDSGKNFTKQVSELSKDKYQFLYKKIINYLMTALMHR